MLFSNRSLEWILSTKYRWIQHLIFWTFMYMPHILMFAGVTGKPPRGIVMFAFLGVLLIDMGLVYFNLYFLIPKFFLKRRYWNYILWGIGLMIADSFFSTAIVPFLLSDGKNFAPSLEAFVESFVLTTNVLGTAVGFNIIKRFLRAQARVKELETTGLKAELAYLKNQINPHFLFNSLNNIYVQARTAPNDASESILQLSDLLRYQLYDCTKDRVNLNDEIEYLENYLKIDKLRKTRAELDFEVHGTPNGVKVAPFLFIPFIENALKHGISLENESFIKILFDIRPNELVFEIANSKPQQPMMAHLKGGIGLANISRRLDILYPNAYQLDIDNQKTVYKVRLAIAQKKIAEF
jgi:two-component system, LytTR family, sensor kinase